MDEFVCLTVQSQPGETAAAFSARLSRFWTHMLRQFQAEFEKVYAEETVFETSGTCVTRRYLVEPDVIELLQSEMQKAEVGLAPVDMEDTYSKFEAVAPDWMQIEH